MLTPALPSRVPRPGGNAGLGVQPLVGEDYSVSRYGQRVPNRRADVGEGCSGVI